VLFCQAIMATLVQSGRLVQTIEGPDLTTFRSATSPDIPRRGLPAERAHEPMEAAADSNFVGFKEMSGADQWASMLSMKRTESVGNQMHMWSWAGKGPPSEGTSRESSAHGGTIFKRGPTGDSMKREGSVGSLSSLWQWAGVSPPASLSTSREGSAHGGTLFSGMKRVASLGTQIWTLAGKPKEGPDLSCERSATSPEGMRPPPPQPVARRALSPCTDTDRGV
jgi:hypothetical protein